MFTEYEIKAEFVERLTRFVDWPDSAFADARSEFNFCAWGYGPLTRQLERTLPRGRVKARPARLLHVSSTEQITSCHVLYVVSADRNAIRSLAKYLLGKPILSVGDQPGLADEGLLVNLVLTEDGHVRIELNQTVAHASGLKVSAKLMHLARLVGRPQ